MLTPTPSRSKPTTLAQLIAKCESNNDQFAVRFERLYHPKSDNVSKLAHQSRITFTTAEILCSMSFGYYQIMGDNLVSLGLEGSIIEYCASPQLQDVFFNRYCTQNHCVYSLEEILTDQTKREDFAKKYNGPGNITAYSQRLLAMVN